MIRVGSTVEYRTWSKYGMNIYKSKVIFKAKQGDLICLEDGIDLNGDGLTYDRKRRIWS